MLVVLYIYYSSPIPAPRVGRVGSTRHPRTKDGQGEKEGSKTTSNPKMTSSTRQLVPNDVIHTPTWSLKTLREHHPRAKDHQRGCFVVF